MCNPKAKTCHQGADIPPPVAQIDGRPVLQPTCNRVPSLERRNSLKKVSQKKSPPPPPPLPISSSTTTSPVASAKIKTSITSPPISPNLRSPRPPALKRGNIDPNGLNSSAEKALLTPRCTVKSPTLEKKKKKKSSCGDAIAKSIDDSSLIYSSSLIIEAPGSIAAARREKMTLLQAQRKMRIAHYGRSKSANFERQVVPLESSTMTATGNEEKRCSFITPNSDPLYVAYHDEEWGVPVHDDNLLFELLALNGAQVGSDWTSILKQRQDYRVAFAGFDAATVSKFTEKQITAISADYGIELSRVRGIVDNSNRILEIKKQFGSFDKYLWGFVNHKPISTQYKSGYKIPVKTSKSEMISKDMVRRGFRLVGPTVMHSFMQAAGLTNDHLISCHRHLHCAALSSHRPPVAVAL